MYHITNVMFFFLVRPRFTDTKIKSFMVVRAGNSARFNINFEVMGNTKSILLGYVYTRGEHE